MWIHGVENVSLWHDTLSTLSGLAKHTSLLSGYISTRVPAADQAQQHNPKVLQYG